MKLTLGSLMHVKAATIPPPAKPKTAPMPRVTKGGSTLHLRRFPLSKVRIGGGY